MGPGVPGEVWALPLATHGDPIHLLGSQFSENRAAISPDGRWIAYRSNESGKFEDEIGPVLSAIPSRAQCRWRPSRKSSPASGRTKKDPRPVRRPDGAVGVQIGSEARSGCAREVDEPDVPRGALVHGPARSVARLIRRNPYVGICGAGLCAAGASGVWACGILRAISLRRIWLA
jgi:hypothetical protein